MKKISICVPVYTMKDSLGEIFLVEFLSMIQFQTFKDFEIVISDQSIGENLKKIVDSFSYVLDIKYFNDPKIDCAAKNVNNAIKHATGEIIKLLYCDDFFVDPFALQKIADAFDTNKNNHWLICGFTHCDMTKTQFFDTRTPWYGNTYVNGDNTTGNPSTYAVRNSHKLEMDENLLWIVDGEYFYRSYYYYGNPIIINDILVCFREHSASVFNDPKYIELDKIEREYCVKKYEDMGK